MKRELAVVITGFVLLVVFGIADRAMAKDAATTYPKMAPIEEYLMGRDAEIALARSAAPDSISHDATVMVLSRQGYDTAVKGTNGWVCYVARGWSGMFDHPEFWSPKIRAAGCVNAPVARSFLPYDYKRTQLILAGHSKGEVIAATKDAIDKKELPVLEPGICYMMSKSSYLGDFKHHDMAHVMFYETGKDGTAWGANLPNSPVVGVNYWSMSTEAYPQLKAFPPIYVYLVPVDKWSDGSAAPAM
jgi:hypothetical protein